MISVYDTHLSAGNGVYVPEYVKTKKKLAFDLDWIIKKGFKADNLKLFPVRGDSMSYTLNDGDLVLIDTSEREVVDGKIYALIVGDQQKIKRLKKTASGGFVIMSDNPSPTYENEIVESGDVDFIQIIGQAVHKSGDL